MSGAWYHWNVPERYELLGPLGKGGMAEVLLARTVGPHGIERLLAVKRILPEHAKDPAHVKMFLDEARNAARLAHHRIVQVFDIDMRDGVLLYAMEYLHGQTLSDVLARVQRLPLAVSIAIAIAVADGLHHAHDRTAPIIHRDVAPSNVMLTYDGNIKLIDFGIAKSASNLSSTVFGTFKGRLGYSSPEQVRCEPIDARSDVYSLSVMLYELTTGRRAFEGGNEEEMIQKMSEARVTPPHELDPALAAIVMKGLARDRENRYWTNELRDALDAYARQAALNVSEQAMAKLMGQLFARELESWHRARATGLSLEEHVVRETLGERPPPPRRHRRRPRWDIRIGIVLALVAAGYAAARLIMAG
jgi:serine/threonine-protein kinase